MNSITLIGVSVIVFYSITQVLTFYGVGEDQYGIYLVFYLFLILCVLILPNDYPKV